MKSSQSGQEPMQVVGFYIRSLDLIDARFNKNCQLMDFFDRDAGPCLELALFRAVNKTRMTSISGSIGETKISGKSKD